MLEREGEVTEGMTWWQREARLTGGGHAQVKECGADANAADEDGSTAVMGAAMGGHTATAVALVRTVLGEEIAAGGEGAAAGSVMARASTSMMTGVCVRARIRMVWEGSGGRVGGNIES